MFDVAPTELMVVAIVALLVIGPKDLPKAMRFVGKWVGKARAMSRHFRSGLDTMMREAELEEMEKQWREHNAEIMRNYPNVAQTPPSLPAPGAGMVGAQMEGEAMQGALHGEPVTHVASAAVPSHGETVTDAHQPAAAAPTSAEVSVQGGER